MRVPRETSTYLLTELVSMSSSLVQLIRGTNVVYPLTNESNLTDEMRQLKKDYGGVQPSQTASCIPSCMLG